LAVTAKVCEQSNITSAAQSCNPLGFHRRLTIACSSIESHLCRIRGLSREHQAGSDRKNIADRSVSAQSPELLIERKQFKAA
jgi:hypothetical protein